MPLDEPGAPTPLPSPSDAPLEELEGIYKDIHAHPELSMQEHRTAGLAADWLKKHGYEVTEGVGGTGVVGLLRNGDGPTVLLRADMDALPIEESTGLDYASTATGTDRFGQETSIAHSCGHDMHVVWLMGAPNFAPVIDPTLRTGIDAMLAAAGAWLSSAPGASARRP